MVDLGSGRSAAALGGGGRSRKWGLHDEHFASDNALVDPSEHRPVYRGSELLALVGLAKLRPQELHQIHRVKRTFKGTVLA